MHSATRNFGLWHKLTYKIYDVNILVPIWLIIAIYRNWLSLLPRRLIIERCTNASRADWQLMHVRTPGRAARRRSGMSSPQSSQYSALGSATYYQLPHPQHHFASPPLSLQHPYVAYHPVQQTLWRGCRRGFRTRNIKWPNAIWCRWRAK